MFFIQSSLIFCCFTGSNAINFEIEGQIDLDNNWNYEVKLSEVTDGQYNFTLLRNTQNILEKKKKEKRHRLHKKKSNNSNFISRTETKEIGSQGEGGAKINISMLLDSKEIGVNNEDNLKIPPLFKQHADVRTSHLIKNDEMIQRYIVHLYNHALVVLDNMQKKFQNILHKHKFQKVKQLYREKIEDHIERLEKQTLRTKLGTQKAILSTLDVSNRIITKLFDHLNLYMRNSLKNENSSNDLLHKELENELSSEFTHLCKQYNICKTRRSFGDFLTEILTMILKTDNSKVKQASDALTEALKDVFYVKIMDWESHKKFRALINVLENKTERETRIIFLILKNVIAQRNQPIKLYGPEDFKLINKTVAFHDVLNEFDKAIPGNNNNTQEWDILLKRLDKWVHLSEYRNNIADIWVKLLDIVDLGIQNMTEDASKMVKNNMRLIFA